VLFRSRKYWRLIPILRPILKLFNWVSTSTERIHIVCDAGAVKSTLKAIERHLTQPQILAPAMHFLTRAAAQYPPATDYLLRKRAVPTVIEAMKSLYAHEDLQLEGLKMLQALSRYEEGWRQISDMKGGWQSITQGVSKGDELLHELEGAFHNPGWCIGETPFLPDTDKKKLIAAQVAAQNSLSSQNIQWTSNALKIFTGRGLKDQKLSINIEFDVAYFDLIESLDLLPKPGEDLPDWYIRLNVYEKENSITIEDMVRTVLDMKKRESKEREMATKAAENGEHVKPLFVKGKRVTTKALDEADRGIDEELDGII